MYTVYNIQVRAGTSQGDTRYKLYNYTYLLELLNIIISTVRSAKQGIIQ